MVKAIYVALEGYPITFLSIISRAQLTTAFGILGIYIIVFSFDSHLQEKA